MTILRGRAHIKLDEKGRLSWPSGFRKSFGKTTKLFVTNTVVQGHPALDLYSPSEWLKLEKKVSKWPELKTEVQAFQRFYISSAEECSIDSQGRMLIPQHLRDYARLNEEIVLVGMGHKIEIWNAATWANLFRHMGNDLERIMGVLADLKGKDQK